VAIVGAFESWGRERTRPRPGKVTVAFGPPIDFSSWIGDDERADLERITAELRRSIAALVMAHGGPPPAEAGQPA
jgi:1-acyl-sn-glycerol-3-phosphate acyltransferase